MGSELAVPSAFGKYGTYKNGAETATYTKAYREGPKNHRSDDAEQQDTTLECAVKSVRKRRLTGMHL